jgi:hypothetical protein
VGLVTRQLMSSSFGVGKDNFVNQLKNSGAPSQTSLLLQQKISGHIFHLLNTNA